MEFDINWLYDPEVFQVNTLPPVSDHQIYATEQEADQDATSLVRSLNGTWAAHFSIIPEDEPDALLTGDSMDDQLMPVTVPGEFQMQNPDWDPPHYVNTQYPWDGRENLAIGEVSREYNPTVTAVRVFELSEEDMKSDRIVLTFGGIEPAMALWINGVFTGYSEDSFTPHHFDVTGLVKAGKNRLAVRVFKRCTGVWMEDQDFWRFSGIHRDVTLTFEKKTHLNDIFVRTPLEDGYTRAFLEADLKIDRPCGTVSLTLTDKAGAVLLYIEKDAAAALMVREEVPGVKLWSAEEPNLYTLTAVLKDEAGETVEVSRLKVGFRQFEMINKIMCLNGKRIVFHGVNRHEFDCDLGRVMTKETLMRDIRDMKGMNVNAVRTCHYPNSSMLYRMCDEYGLYVIDETNIETHGTWSDRTHEESIRDCLPGNRPDWKEAVLARGRAMQERDKNHACILLWSCGNESYGGSVLYDLSMMFRARDNTRLVHYEGTTNDTRYTGTTDVYSRMYAKVADIEAYLANDPDKPFINCEYTHAMGNSCGGMVLYTELEDKQPMYQGGFIWDYVDQGLRVKGPNGATRLAYGGDFGDRPTDWHFNTNGIILGDRSFTPKVQEVRQLYRPADITPDAKGVTVKNLNKLAPLSGYALKWDTLVNGVKAQCGEADLPDVAAGESVYVALPIEAAEGETVITVKLCVKQDALLPEGWELCFGQTVLGQPLPKAESPEAPEALIPYSANIGMKGEGYRAIITKNEGMTSFHDALGHETILHAPKLSLFRAPTDNDNGNKMSVAHAIYMPISLFPAISRAETVGAKIRFVHTSPALPGVEVEVSYTALKDGVRVEAKWPGAKDLPDLPCFGLQLLMESRLTEVSYLGYGPDDNYSDRCTGAAFGQYSYEVKDGWTRYAKPQESGNRMGVRRMLLTDKDGHGVEITGTDLQISAQPYAPEELLSVWHPDELQGSCRTVLNVACIRRGIGGDDSWGAPVLPQYTCSAAQPYTLTFEIRPV